MGASSTDCRELKSLDFPSEDTEVSAEKEKPWEVASILGTPWSTGHSKRTDSELTSLMASNKQVGE